MVDPFCIKTTCSSLYSMYFIIFFKKNLSYLTELLLAKNYKVHGVKKITSYFNIEKIGNQIHVLNAPSPGATSALAIASYVIENYV